MTSSPYIFTTSLSTFAVDVIEASKEAPILVDFTSPRSQLSAKLSPLLDKLVIAENGAVRLTHINIDENPQIAQQLRLESIPTLYAFFNGQVVDGFAGLLPEPQIRNWLKTFIKTTGAKATDENAEDAEAALTQAETHFEEGDYYTANAIYLDVLEYVPDEPRAHAGKIRCLIAEKKIKEAQAAFDALPDNIKKDPALAPVRTALDLATQSQGIETDIIALQSKLTQNENDHQTRFDLAMAYYGTGEYQYAIDCLLDIIRKNRKWEDDKARKQLLKFFEALGQTHPLTIDTRKRLSTILFS
ncbi:MAG: tetratricopeptide repeat protein [Bdellovibrionales bacterium]